MVSDLVDSSSAGQPLEALMFGGAPAPNSLPPRAHKAFPNAALSQGYGLTETNSVAVGVAGEDYSARPTTCGLATPVNDVIIVKDGVVQPPNAIGEVWIRGPNVMQGYWNDPVATDKALTKDGWLLTGDLGYLDEEGFLYIRDRIKDIIIRGGENIDSVTVENALYADECVLEAAAVSVPDARLGELVAAAVTIKPPYWGKVTEAELVKQAAKSLPKFAVPVIIVVQSEPFERTPSGKILKGQIRDIVREAWKNRLAASGGGASAKL
ncbi:long-chain-fatty-acid-CoA ligase [Coprinopsis cinerea AmutBmut pab1-1]|nr:long-chain-fatty-acid-CoA ligase [Coprinopsis cinerea AmutBmut pab1-1]